MEVDMANRSFRGLVPLHHLTCSRGDLEQSTGAQGGGAVLFERSIACVHLSVSLWIAMRSP